MERQRINQAADEMVRDVEHQVDEIEDAMALFQRIDASLRTLEMIFRVQKGFLEALKNSAIRIKQSSAARKTSGQTLRNGYSATFDRSPTASKEHPNCQRRSCKRPPHGYGKMQRIWEISHTPQDNQRWRVEP